MAEAARRTRIGAYALCVDADDRILLCRIAPGYPVAGRWSLPGGGVEFGEDPSHAVLRELDEETGLAGRLDGVLGIWSRLVPGTETQSGDELHVVGIVYRVHADPADLRIEVGGSTDAAAWFTRDELAGLDIGDLALFGLSLIAH